VLGVGGTSPRAAREGAGQVQGFAPNVFVAFQADGTVIITASRSEMGQGVRTALPRVVADDIEADWNRVRVVQAVGDKKFSRTAIPRSAPDEALAGSGRRLVSGRSDRCD